jgi:hypothetical protein
MMVAPNGTPLWSFRQNKVVVLDKTTGEDSRRVAEEQAALRCAAKFLEPL